MDQNNVKLPFPLSRYLSGIFHNVRVFVKCSWCFSARMTRISSQQYTSVTSAHQDEIYAATEGVYSVVCRYHFTSSGKWEKILCFPVIDGWKTLNINKQRITCGSQHKNEVAVYHINGTLLRKSGQFRTDKSGHFSGLYVSDNDDAGNVLIADRWNDKLHVMTSSRGRFYIVSLEPSVKQPRAAVLFNGDLYVTSCATKSLYRYSWVIFVTLSTDIHWNVNWNDRQSAITWQLSSNKVDLWV